MDGSFAVSLVVGVVSVVLAGVAIWHSTQSERKSADNYKDTKDVLSEISQKAAVIEATVSKTQEKLVDTVTAIARPKEETQEDMITRFLMSAMTQNPQLLEQVMRLSEQQEKKPKGSR